MTKFIKRFSGGFEPNASTTFANETQVARPAAMTPTVKPDPFFSVPSMVIGNLDAEIEDDHKTKVSITF